LRGRRRPPGGILITSSSLGEEVPVTFTPSRRASLNRDPRCLAIRVLISCADVPIATGGTSPGGCRVQRKLNSDLLRLSAASPAWRFRPSRLCIPDCCPRSRDSERDPLRGPRCADIVGQ